MIHLIVWSKNRAAQLHLLLESIEKNMPDSFITSVIYTHTPEFESGYDRLMSEFDDSRFGFFREVDFHNQTMSLVSDQGFDNVAFSTDDTVVYRDHGKFDEGLMDNSICTFSLRYGLNTTVQNYHTGQLQPPLNVAGVRGFHPEVLDWVFSHYGPHDNYGYPFGLDMHIFNREMMLGLLKYMPFKNTNELESGLFHKKAEVPQNIRSFRYSVAVNIPNNNLSGVTRAGEVHSHSVEELNRAYVDGKKIDLHGLMLHDVHGCHQEIPMELIDG